MDDGRRFFSTDDRTARDRFRDAAAGVGALVESIPIAATGPGGRALAIEVARWGDARPRRLLIVSSGLHGVEGFFGSAVELAALGDRLGGWEPGAGEAVLWLHGLNPYGFAWLRRFDDGNVDLNRNFLRDGEPYRGSPPGYAALSPLLNPRTGGGPLDTIGFRARAFAAIARIGLPALKESVAVGQYDRPEGLFFGGHGPSEVHRIVASHLSDWVGEAEVVRHLDFHTGLGRRGTYRILGDPAMPPDRADALRERFGADRVDVAAAQGVAYHARGGFGAWLEWRLADRDCVSICPEFGTEGPIAVLGALRDENRAHLYRPEDDPARLRAKARLVEAFAPADPGWRDGTVAQATELLRVARRWTFDDRTGGSAAP